MRVRLALPVTEGRAEKLRRVAGEVVRERYERADFVRSWVEGGERWFEFEAGRRLVRRTRLGIEFRRPYEVVEA